MLDGTMTINADCTSYVPFLTYKGDDVANISPNVEDGGTVVAGALTANMATFAIQRELHHCCRLLRYRRSAQSG